ncbi:MAG TPA: hypothetical protein VJ860_23075, partial [Polyangia bacterium]|nr:hypothetical protein [Polyangia bacterium]
APIEILRPFWQLLRHYSPWLALSVVETGMRGICLHLHSSFRAGNQMQASPDYCVTEIGRGLSDSIKMKFHIIQFDGIGQPRGIAARRPSPAGALEAQIGLDAAPATVTVKVLAHITALQLKATTWCSRQPSQYKWAKPRPKIPQSMNPCSSSVTNFGSVRPLA